MAKKKVERRMKRQVRKTLGALFLASSVAIAAIPTGSYDGGSAAAASSGETYTHEVKAGYFDDSNKAHSTLYGTAFKNPNDIAALQTVYSDGSTIPLCKTTSTIYTTGDGDFQFAYVDSNGDEDGAGSKFAVILGYDHEGNLEGGTLTIPNEVDAYLNYNDNDASRSAYCAVGKAGNFLFYATTAVTQNYYTELQTTNQPKTNEEGKTLYVVKRADGSIFPGSEEGITEEVFNQWKKAGTLVDSDYKETLMVPVQVEVLHYFAPCYYDSRSNWEEQNLYYYPTNNFRPSGTPGTGATMDDKNEKVVPQLAASDGDYGRIIGAPVVYIGKQYLNSSSAGWTIGGAIDESNGTTKGIFAGNTNISTLIIGSNLSGLSDYAFYDCSVGSVTLGNGLNALGNHTFDNCTGLRTVNFDGGSNNLQTIGAYCFNQCRNLRTFNLPNSVRNIGDGAFKGCEGMTSIDLLANGEGRLAKIGAFVFQNCAKLESLTFPSWYNETLELSEFEGCKSLQWIKSENTEFNIVSSQSCNYDWQAFQDEWNGGDTIDIETREKFYLESSNNSALHTTCTANEIAFKYLNTDTYELTKKENSLAGQTGTITYQVDGTDTLMDTKFNGIVTSMNFPEYIGPHTIKKIGDEAFKNQCTLTEVRISSTIREIGASAFQGCHNLKYVFFDSDTVTIGANAFLTQKVTPDHSATCQSYSGLDTEGNTIKLCDSASMTNPANDPTDPNAPAVKLHFVGTVGNESSPYRYAMSYDGHYSDGAQKLSFIEYLSGWPTMLTIRYNYDTATQKGYSELVDFPTLNDLSDYYNAEYLTDTQQEAARSVLTTPAGSRTEDQETFYNASQSLTIPKGVDAIEDGLFADKTDGIAAFPVYCYGLKEIETNYITDDSGNIKYFAGDTDTVGTISPDPARNYFPRADKDKSDFAGAPALTEIHIMGDTTKIDPYAFQNDTNLTTVEVTSSLSELGEHAFQGDTALSAVSFPENLSTIGIAPFKGCTALSDVEFADNPYYTCDNSVIYKTSGGSKTAVVEVLPSRTNSIRPAEMGSEITAIAEEAFTTSKVKVIDLSGTGIMTIPTHTFYEAGADGSRVTLPDTCTTVEPYSFEKSKVNEISARNVTLPEATMLDGIIVGSDDAGNGGVTDSTNTQNNYQVTVNAPEGSYMYTYAVRYQYTPDTDLSKDNYKVTFYGYDSETHKVTKEILTTEVEDGANLLRKDVAAAEQDVVSSYEDSDGYRFVLEGWKDSTVNTYTSAQLLELPITADTDFYAYYAMRHGQSYTVSFNDYYGNVTKTYSVIEGDTLAQEEKDPPVLADVTDDGVTYYHNGWKKSGELSVTDPITRNVTFDPIYTKKTVDTFTVTFYYIDPTNNKMETHTTLTGISNGADISKSVSDPSITGYTFNGWDKATATPSTGDITNVTCDFNLVGTFTKKGSSDEDVSGNNSGKPGGGSNDMVEINGFKIPAYDTDIFAVALYYDKKGDPYSYRLVNIGDKAPDIAKPEGYVTGYKWSPTPAETTVTDVSFFNLVPGTASGGSSTGGDSGNTSSGSGSSTASTAKFYTLTVVNGSGSGSYVSGTQVVISANTPVSGQEFSNWTIDPSETSIASKVMSATVVTMPSESVTVTAHYKAATSSSTSSGTSSSNNSSGKPNSNSGSVSSGTTVVIDKNGLSNTGVVTATVKGSSDNFTIKVTESTDAAEAVVKALQAEYGDISGIKYFPMDISLYDSTGTKKITDTTGLSISITLPIPDALTTYAGNNKIAGVVNNRLDKLSPKFTTIDGVACMTFTAEHFSPYVIYVDTDHLNASVIADNTPKTGDGIHPKWFLSLGLAGIAGVLFMKRDKKTTRKVKTA